MSKFAFSAASILLILVQLTLLAMAIALIFFPAARGPHLHGLFKLLFYVECAALLYRAIRAGRGNVSPEVDMSRLLDGQSAAITTPFERIAFLSAVVAMAFLAFQ